MKLQLKKSALTLLLFIVLFYAFIQSLKISTVRASAAIYIRADGSIEPQDAPIQKNGDIYTLTGNVSSENDGIQIERNNMTLDGLGYVIQGAGTAYSAGVFLVNRTNVTIVNVKVKSFSYGVLIQLSSNNTVSESYITATDWDGVKLTGSSSYNCIIANNITDNNGNGIGFYSSSNNTIIENNIDNNIQNGIHLFWSSNNTICHNSFVNNGRQAYTEQSYNNVWDYGYPRGGNYWSDYDGSDLKSGIDQNVAGSDGIGDAPYIINSLNTDRYPIIPEFSSLSAPIFVIISLLAVKICKKKGIR